MGVESIFSWKWQHQRALFDMGNNSIYANLNIRSRGTYLLVDREWTCRNYHKWKCKTNVALPSAHNKMRKCLWIAFYGIHSGAKQTNNIRTKYFSITKCTDINFVRFFSSSLKSIFELVRIKTNHWKFWFIKKY